MRNALTISLPAALAKSLDASAKRSGKTRSQWVQDAVRKSLFIEHLDRARKELIPSARKQGIFTDEDVFKIVS